MLEADNLKNYEVKLVVFFPFFMPFCPLAFGFVFFVKFFSFQLPILPILFFLYNLVSVSGHPKQKIDKKVNIVISLSNFKFIL